MKERIDLQGANVLVTGATGFIGGRLVDYLSAHFRANVRVLVRSYGRAVRLARYPVELVPGDLTDPASLQRACAECDIVFHCGFSPAGEDEFRRRVIVDGTDFLIQAALAAGVKRFVHVSTVAVHGPDPGPVIDADTPLIYTGDVYADAKVDAEKLVFQAIRQHELPAVVIRPTIVYGPHGGSWTLGPLHNLKQGKLTLYDNGEGIANHVYIDDVVQALLLAATRPEAIGQAFLASYGSGVTWQEFFGHYARMTGVALPNLTTRQIEEARKLQQRLRNPLYLGLSFVASPRAQSLLREMPGAQPVLRLVGGALPASTKRSLLARATAIREVKLRPPDLPRPWILQLFHAKGVCNIDKTRQLLGYHPQFPLDVGMSLTESWLHEMRLL